MAHEAILSDQRQRQALKTGQFGPRGTQITARGKEKIATTGGKGSSRRRFFSVFHSPFRSSSGTNIVTTEEGVVQEGDFSPSSVPPVELRARDE